MQWYYAVNNQRQGPLAESEFEKLVADGIVKGDTLVWRTGMAEWRPYASVAATLPPAPGTGDDTAVCAVSGQRYPKREMIQYEGQWISAEHRDTFFQRLREGVVTSNADGMPGPHGYGGFWERFVAKFLDGLIVGVVSVLLNVTLSAIIFSTPNYIAGVREGTEGQRLAFQLTSNVIGIALGLSYAIFFIRRYSATPGKMALGLKLVRADGSPLSVGRIVARHFAEWLSAFTLTIGYVMAAFDDEKRSLHDRICDTRVIKTR
jgi:uncharacterized RDD family membrane protein YckC